MKTLVTFASLLLVAISIAEAQTLEYTVMHCGGQAAADQDGDGLSDACESELAFAFAPLLRVRTGGCNWNEAVDRLGGGYFYAVQPLDSVIRVAYMPAYFRDCGWTGWRCWLPFVDCSPHEGDSEFIVVEVVGAGSAARWRVSGIFLSAHCFGKSGASCRWYRGPELNEFAWAGTSPIVWVAEGRQANYSSSTTCDRGHYALDRCSRHNAQYYFPVSPDRNIGSSALPNFGDGCVRGSDLATEHAQTAASECFWTSDTRFRGWQLSGRGVTPYERYLREVAGF
jgi:hypothetical protein